MACHPSAAACLISNSIEPASYSTETTAWSIAKEAGPTVNSSGRQTPESRSTESGPASTKIGGVSTGRGRRGTREGDGLRFDAVRIAGVNQAE